MKFDNEHVYAYFGSNEFGSTPESWKYKISCGNRAATGPLVLRCGTSEIPPCLGVFKTENEIEWINNLKDWKIIQEWNHEHFFPDLNKLLQTQFIFSLN